MPELGEFDRPCRGLDHRRQPGGWAAREGKNNAERIEQRAGLLRGPVFGAQINQRAAQPIRVVFHLLPRDESPRRRAECPALVPAERGTQKQLFALVRRGPCVAEGAPVKHPGRLGRVNLELAAYEFDDLEEFATSVQEILGKEGPVFVAVKVTPEVENMPIGLRQRRPTRGRAETISSLREELGIGD